MPIFEFKCSDCGHLFEKLFLDSKEEVVLECPQCHSHNLERVVSRVNYVMGTKGKGPKITTKSCGPGSTCATIEIPGRDD
ncbi:regulatory protein, FmdB family [Ammonifex degensii KC4]|uniref:Regulatory protein, FmdB family n=1 Tax=Ammonifex degensii (strain DSM 10501 / KC4) TaxID=429009 RepID=C9RA36_AMMDK|nr:zinc ribbon domain-containing protein [Ammonifex degensii]ACX53165.1 regulatory protein, FmdB family [Ammonifex degensii KC4]